MPGTDPTIQQVIQTMILASVLTGVFVALCSIAGRWIGGVWTTLLATLVAILLAYKPLLGTSLFQGSNFDLEIVRRIVVATMIFTLVSIALSFKKVPWFARLAFAGIGPGLLLWWVFLHEHQQTVSRPFMLVHGVLPVAAVVLVLWALIEPLAVRSRGVAGPLVVACLSTGITFLLALSTEDQARQISPLIPGAAAGAVGAGVIAFLVRRPIDFARGPVLLWVTFLAAVFGFMWIDTEKLEINHLLMLGSIPVVAWLVEIKPVRRWKPWQRESLRLALMLVPLTIVIVHAWKEHQAEAAASGDPFSLVVPADDASDSIFA